MIDNETRKPQRSAEQLRRIHVGCGPKNILHDWWNVDILAFPGIDQVVDSTQAWPWVDAVDFVYGEHFLEHLWLEDAVKFLSHAGSALVCGGRLRLSTPSLEWVLSTHFRLDQTDPEKKILETFAVNRAFHGWGHRFLYSKPMLEFVLAKLGFSQIEFFKFGESDTPALSGLERHGTWSVANGFPNTWIVEAVRSRRQISIPPDLGNAIEQGLARYTRSSH